MEATTMMTKKRNPRFPISLAIAVCAGAGFCAAAEPPERVNFQGVLRDNTGAPVTASETMSFLLYDTNACPGGGTLLLTDDQGSVTITGGLFNVALGGGALTPGTATGIGEAFQNNAEVWVEIEVAGETLCPRIRVESAAYAQLAGRSLPADPPCFDQANRFVDCSNGTVTDTVTGLIWLQDAGCFDLFVYQPANEAAGSLGDGQCGLSDNSAPGDWRLPTRSEWLTMINQAVSNGCSELYFPDIVGTGCCGTDTCAFSGLEASFYWSSTTSASNPTLADTGSLGSSFIFTLSKSGLLRVWPVRESP